MRAAITILEDLLTQAVNFHDENSRERWSVWLHETAEAEALADQAQSYGVRRALIYDYTLQQERSTEFHSPLLKDNNELWVATVAIKRGPWETGSEVTVSSPPATLPVGQTWDLSATGGNESGGTLDGRISELRFKANSAAGTGNPYRMWFAIGEHYLGIYDYAMTLNPASADVTPLDGGANVYDVFDSTLALDVAEIDFAGFGESLKFALTRKSTTPYFMVGKHLGLLVARNTVANTVTRLRLSASFKSPADTAGSGTYTYVFANEEEITDDAWHIIDAGVLQLPPSQRSVEPLNNMLNANLYLNIEAERLSGTGNLRLATLFLLPAERRLFIDHAPVAAGSDVVSVYTTENGSVEAHIKDTAGAVELPPVEPVNWRWPKDGGVLYFLAERATGYNRNDEIDNIQLQWYPRWRSYRND